MNTITLNHSGSGVEIGHGLIRFFINTSGGVAGVLRAVDEEGVPLPTQAWTRVDPSWVLDSRQVGARGVLIEAATASGEAFPPGAMLTVTVTRGGSPHYRADFSDLAGRGQRELLTLEVDGDAVHLQRADKESAPSVAVLIDGSASVLGSAVRAELSAVLDQLAGLTVRADAPGQGDPSWGLIQDGATSPLPVDDRHTVWEQPRVIGSVVDDHLFQTPGNYVVVTDEVPEGVDTWDLGEGAVVQLVVLCDSSAGEGRQVRPEVGIVTTDGAGDGTRLATAMAETFGWDK